MWAVRDAFTCHHCQWALSSNVNRAIGRGVWLGLAAELLFLGGLWLGLGSPSRALDVWVCGPGGMAFVVGSVYVNWALRLVPLRPPAGISKHQSAKNSGRLGIEMDQ